MKAEEIKKEIRQVKKCPLFRRVSAEAIESILLEKDTKILTVQAGETLKDSCMYVILEGNVLIEKAASDGRLVTMNIAQAPAPINMAAALSREGSESRLTMQADGRLVCISGRTLEKALKNGGQLALNIALFLTNRINFLNKKIVSLAGYSAASRLSMYLEEQIGKNPEGENMVVIPMSMTDFAEYLGVGRASLYRAMDAMEKSGKIRCTGRRIEIIDDSSK